VRAVFHQAFAKTSGRFVLLRLFFQDGGFVVPAVIDPGIAGGEVINVR
jgi:hypothetical protein